MKKIFLTESQFKKLVDKSLKEAVNEVSYSTVYNAENKTDLNFDSAYDAINILREVISTYDSDSFLRGSEVMNYYMSNNGKTPARPAAELDGYLDKIEAFIRRKEAQHSNFEQGKVDVENRNQEEILTFARQNGYNVNTMEELSKALGDYEEVENFIKSLPVELREYAEEWLPL